MVLTPLQLPTNYSMHFIPFFQSGLQIKRNFHQPHCFTSMKAALLCAVGVQQGSAATWDQGPGAAGTHQGSISAGPGNQGPRHHPSQEQGSWGTWGHWVPPWGQGQAGMLARRLTVMFLGQQLGLGPWLSPAESRSWRTGVGLGWGQPWLCPTALSGSPAGRGRPPWPSISDPAHRLRSQTPKPGGCTHALTLNVARDFTYIQVASQIC